MTVDYPAFLAARLDELEQNLDIVGSSMHARLLAFERADIAAKRKILEHWREAKTNQEATTYNDVSSNWSFLAQGLHDAIELLCRPFADHPDYPGGER